MRGSHCRGSSVQTVEGEDAIDMHITETISVGDHKRAMQELTKSEQPPTG